MEELQKNKNTVAIHIEDEMKNAYLDYAMSVIVGRALPDVRDGLKPVHRRVLFAMHDLGNVYNKPYKKSARVVGDVIGKYHPHGDTAVYDTMVRMAQDFSLRNPLVDGQGNFGSIDGDSPAAMRYTEVRMSKITTEMLADIQKETVDFQPNYDGSLKEPVILPAKIPNLLVNGSSGIAVGMATNIPPHNLSEIADAIVALVNNPDLTFEELFAIVKGPDFPTGGQICGLSGVLSAYRTGKGVIQVRAVTEVESNKKGDRERIVVKELPYQVNKARLLEKIADLVRNKKIEGIADLKDESDRSGMRMVIDLKKGENAEVILNRLYKLTQMQESFGIIMLALDKNRPKIFSLKEVLESFISHRREIILRRTLFDLKKAEEKAHLLEGLKKALENIDEIVQLIKSAASPKEAKEGLIDRFQFSDLQAQAILDMRLHRLTSLEREKIVRDYEETLKLIADLKEILKSDQRVREIIVTEVSDLKAQYGDDRRTEIIEGDLSSIEDEDLIADEDMVVAVTKTGFIKRSSPDVYRAQRRGGKGVKGMTTNEEDFVSSIFKTSNLSTLLCFTDKGRLHWLKVYKVPEGSRIAKGKAIVNLIKLGPDEKLKTIVPIREFKKENYVIMVTKKGVIKKTDLSQFSNVRSSGIAAIGIDEGDELIETRISDGGHHVFLCSKKGKSIRFDEKDVRPMGRAARGVRGFDLEKRR